MILYLIRHGETELNRQQRYVGWQDPPLTPEGHAQAESLALRLTQAESRPRLILTSDLRRARQTAAPIAAALGLTPRPDPRLREVSFGAFEGHTYAEIAASYPAQLKAWLDDPEATAPPGGETLKQLRDRLLAAVTGSGESPVAIVTHGGPIRTLLHHFTGRPFWEPQLPPGSLTVLEVAP